MLHEGISFQHKNNFLHACYHDVYCTLLNTAVCLVYFYTVLYITWPYGTNISAIGDQFVSLTGSSQKSLVW